MPLTGHEQWMLQWNVLADAPSTTNFEATIDGVAYNDTQANLMSTYPTRFEIRICAVTNKATFCYIQLTTDENVTAVIGGEEHVSVNFCCDSPTEW